MTDFTAPPAGMLSEQVNLPDHQLSMGLMHGETGIRICVWDGRNWRHLTAEAATKFANQLDETVIFRHVTAALRKLVERVSEIQTKALMRRVSRTVARKFADMPVEGHA